MGGYKLLKGEFVNYDSSACWKKGRSFPEMHRVIMNFKSWLQGMHHSVQDLQEYLNEYTYRFNRSSIKEGIFDNLLNRMVEAMPCTYKRFTS